MIRSEMSCFVVDFAKFAGLCTSLEAAPNAAQAAKLEPADDGWLELAYQRSGARYLGYWWSHTYSKDVLVVRADGTLPFSPKEALAEWLGEPLK
jgi:hypothetical protein